MSLELSILSGKEHRKPYYGAKAIDASCRNHGNHGHGPGNECPWCKRNRLHSNRVREEKAKYDQKELG